MVFFDRTAKSAYEPVAPARRRTTKLSSLGELSAQDKVMLPAETFDITKFVGAVGSRIGSGSDDQAEEQSKLAWNNWEHLISRHDHDMIGSIIYLQILISRNILSGPALHFPSAIYTPVKNRHTFKSQTLGKMLKK